MALEVEDGTGKANAESYVSVADADARMAALGLTNWTTLTTAEKEQALRRAAQYMLQSYRDRWQGYRTSTTQALDWPRAWVIVDRYTYIDNDVVPADVAAANADLAFKAAYGDLNADLARGVVREKVGPIETEYDRASPQSVRYRAIDMLLAPYLKGAAGMARLVRA